MYIAGLVIPVSEDKLEAYRAWAVRGVSSEIPFDPKRLVFGCFRPIHVAGRDEAGGQAGPA
ncbi:MAG: hypothetical protein JSR59_22570 [Proteobacteria bacterium]|nr:hypothetical protein [Pseudomonadota bacterium]